MLEIRNVTKIYRSKKGESVKALDNVSVSFPEAGMVFILGKSGSGKSTLLNVIGGLDSYDSGEFVIMGKSSKDFAQSDFDAYRNTFIGFIFQEYNVLDEFSVGANIGLALELQGKKATNEKINSILSQVDLANYASRKPNELSGGQKQRVAIARALVKEPQIIMADEPTGALDSNTGKQIFDSLKELSKEKLVLIVSHDRDFAEKYADRIIELSDGQIISDVTKHEHQSVRLSEGLHKISQRMLKIEKGYRLTAADLEMINKYLSEANGDIILSGDTRINDELRSAAGITEHGGTTAFEDTNAESDYSLKEYDGKKTKFIHSRLPMKNALKMGASGLKHKKFRLALTIILSMLAFAMFGLADTMAVYEKITAATESIIDSQIKTASVALGVRHDYYHDGELTSSYHQPTAMNDDDVKSLSEQSGINFIPVFTGSMYSENGGFSIAQQYISFQQNNVYNGKMTGVVNIDNDTLNQAGLNIIAGRLPEKEGEIAITELMLSSFNEYGFKNAAKNETIAAGSLNNAQDIIGKHITIQPNGAFIINSEGFTYEIVGVVDTHFDYNRYNQFLPQDNTNIMNNSNDGMEDIVLEMELRSELAYGFHALTIMHGNDIKDLASSVSKQMIEVGTYIHGFKDEAYFELVDGNSSNDDKFMSSYTFNRIAQSSDLNILNIKWVNGAKTALAPDEVVLPENIYQNLIPNQATLTINKTDFINKVNELYPNGNFNINSDNVMESLNNAIQTDAEANNSSFSYTKILPYILETVYGITDIDISSLSNSNIMNNAVNNLINNTLYELDTETFSRDIEYYFIRNTLANLYSAIAFEKHDLAQNQALINEYLEQNKDVDWEDIESWDKENRLYWFYNNYYIMNNMGNSDIEATFTYKDLEEICRNSFLTISGTSLDELLGNVTIRHTTRNHELNTKNTVKEYKVKIVGFIENDNTGFNNGIIVNDTMLSDYTAWYDSQFEDEGSFKEVIVPHQAGIWAFAIAPMGSDKATIQKLVEMTYDESGDFNFSLKNSVMNSLDSFNSFIEVGAKIFLYVGLGFALFSALLLMNFIAISISYKKREIGILRAVGARSSDVFKIFFSESLIIALINFILAIATVVVSTNLLNGWMRSEGIKITLLTFGIRQVILMLLVSIVVALIASFLPVYNIAKRKPIDAIKDR